MSVVPVVLASASPRRRELISLLIDDVVAIATDSDESFNPHMAPPDIAESLAVRKAVAGLADHPGAVVVGADTIVVCDGNVLNKPVDRADARGMLEWLSGRAHDVFTGVAVAGPDSGALETECVQSTVWFRQLTIGDIDSYLDSGVWTDKAGAYGIQGEGGDIVDRVDGCFQNVVGFPLCVVGHLLQKSGVGVKRVVLPCGLRSSATCPYWPEPADSGASEPAVD